MPRTRHEFVKLEIRLMNDPRFFMLSEYDQLLYIKLLCLAKQTRNHIRKDWRAIGEYARLFGRQADFFGRQGGHFGKDSEPYRTPIGVKSAVNRLLRRFEDLTQDKYYLWFRKWDTRYEDYRGVDKDKDKDKEKEIKNPDLEFYKKKTEEFKKQSQK